METTFRGILVTWGVKGIAVNQVWGAGNQMELGYNAASFNSFTVIQGGSNTTGAFPGTKFARPNPPNHIEAFPNTEIRVRCEVINRELKYWISVGKDPAYRLFSSCIASLQYYYFKAGNYDQETNNTGLIPDLRDQRSIVDFKEITVYRNPVRGRLLFHGGEPVPEFTEVIYTISGGGLPAPFTGSVLTDKDGYYWVKNVPLQLGFDTCASVEIMLPLSIGGRSPNRPRIAVPPRPFPITEVYLAPDVYY